MPTRPVPFKQMTIELAKGKVDFSLPGKEKIHSFKVVDAVWIQDVAASCQVRGDFIVIKDGQFYVEYEDPQQTKIYRVYVSKGE